MMSLKNIEVQHVQETLIFYVPRRLRKIEHKLLPSTLLFDYSQTNGFLNFNLIGNNDTIDTTPMFANNENPCLSSFV